MVPWSSTGDLLVYFREVHGAVDDALKLVGYTLYTWGGRVYTKSSPNILTTSEASGISIKKWMRNHSALVNQIMGGEIYFQLALSRVLEWRRFWYSSASIQVVHRESGLYPLSGQKY